MKTLIFNLLLNSLFYFGFMVSNVGSTCLTSDIQNPKSEMDTLPARADLFAALRSFHAETDSANIEGLKVQTKYSWLHWLPSVGVTFGKPSVGFSLAQVATNIETKALRKAQKAAILRAGILAFKADSLALVALMQRHETLLISLPILKAAQQIEADKFTFQTERNDKGNVNPLDWLNIKADNLRSGDALRARLEEITLLEIDIRKTAKY